MFDSIARKADTEESHMQKVIAYQEGAKELELLGDAKKAKSYRVSALICQIDAMKAKFKASPTLNASELIHEIESQNSEDLLISLSWYYGDAAEICATNGNISEAVRLKILSIEYDIKKLRQNAVKAPDRYPDINFQEEMVRSYERTAEDFEAVGATEASDQIRTLATTVTQ